MADPLVKIQLRHRARMGQKVKIRKPKKWLHPSSAERQLEHRILETISTIQALFRRMVLPALQSYTAEAKRLRGDAWSDDLTALLRALRQQVDVDGPDESRAAAAAASQISDWNMGQWRGVVKESLGINVFATEPWLRDDLKSWSQETANLITTLEDDAVKQVALWTNRGIRQGERWEEIAKTIEDRFDVSRGRARFIARDQTAKLNGDLTQRRQKDAGVTHYIWRDSRDERVRGNPGGKYPGAKPSHWARNGQRFSWAQPPEGGAPGMDYNCFPGYAPILLNSPAKKAFRRWHSGDLTSLITDSGKSVDTTPNHPILTARGWLAAHLVKVGDYLIEAPDQGGQFGISDPERGDATAEQVFRSLKARGVFKRVSAGGMRFHGDSVDQEIEVVEFDRELLLDFEPEVLESLEDDRLSIASAPAFGNGHLPLGGIGLGLAPHSGVRGSSQARPLFLGSSIHSNLHSLTPTADRLAMLDQDPINRAASYLEAGGDALVALATSIKPDDFRFRKVTEIMRTPHHGWVYNFETVSGWYSSHDLIVHNCRCTAEPDLNGLLEAFS